MTAAELKDRMIKAVKCLRAIEDAHNNAAQITMDSIEQMNRLNALYPEVPRDGKEMEFPLNVARDHRLMADGTAAARKEMEKLIEALTEAQKECNCHACKSERITRNTAQ